jgi:hypothetical protein
MNDTITAHKLVSANITGSVVDATARSFPRVIGSNSSEALRQSLHIGSMSPSVVRIAHQPRKSDVDVQRTLCALDQTLARLDAQSNVISTTRASVALQTNIPSDLSLTEWREMVYLLIGTLTESNGAVLDALFNREA